MKNPNYSILFLLVLMMLVGCTSNNENVSTNTSKTESQENAIEDLTFYEIFNIGDESKFSDGIINFYVLENNIDDISKDTGVRSVIVIDYEEKNIKTFSYLDKNIRTLSE
ncbi:hypothetical protein, partial [Candidatus Enterococcus willemsii]